MRAHKTPVVRGIAFGVADLLLVQAWAEFHSLQMRVELDIVVEQEAFEEVLALYSHQSKFRSGMIWRESNGIWLQLASGPAVQLALISDALGNWPTLHPEEPVRDIPHLDGWWSELPTGVLIPAAARA